MNTKTLLVDFDGVLRHWQSSLIDSAEASYKSAFKKENVMFGSYSDGSGKRYSLFVLYFALGDIKKLEEYTEFFEKNFPDDSGEPG